MDHCKNFQGHPLIAPRIWAQSLQRFSREAIFYKNVLSLTGKKRADFGQEWPFWGGSINVTDLKFFARPII